MFSLELYFLGSSLFFPNSIDILSSELREWLGAHGDCPQKTSTQKESEGLLGDIAQAIGR